MLVVQSTITTMIYLGIHFVLFSSFMNQSFHEFHKFQGQITLLQFVAALYRKKQNYSLSLEMFALYFLGVT